MIKEVEIDGSPAILDTDLLRSQVSAEAYSRIINDMPPPMIEADQVYDAIMNTVVYPVSPYLVVEPYQYQSVAERTIEAQAIISQQEIQNQIDAKNALDFANLQLQLAQTQEEQRKAEELKQLADQALQEAIIAQQKADYARIDAEAKVLEEQRAKDIESLGELPMAHLMAQTIAIKEELPDIPVNDILKIVATSNPTVLVQSGLAEVDVPKLTDVYPNDAFNILSDIQSKSPLTDEVAAKLVSTGVVTQTGSKTLKSITKAYTPITIKSLGFIDRIVNYVYKTLYKK